MIDDFLKVLYLTRHTHKYVYDMFDIVIFLGPVFAHETHAVQEPMFGLVSAFALVANA
jgi:hypothetical protein